MISPMQRIDEFLKQQVEDFKDAPAYSQIIETYSSLEDWQQEAIKFAMMVFSILIPLIFTFIFYLFYSSANYDLVLQENIIKNANQIIASRADLRKSSNILNPYPIPNQNALESKLSAFGVDTSKMRVASGSFDIIEANGISEMQASIEFKEISSKDLYDYLNKLSFRAKFKFREILINKNPKNNLLEGSFGVSQFSKLPDEQEI